MPAAHSAEESSIPDYSKLDATELLSSKPRTSQQTTVPVNTTQSERRPPPTGHPLRRDSQDVKPHNSEREPKKPQGNRELQDTLPPVIATSTTATTTTTKKRPPSTDRNDDRPGRSSHREASSDSDWSLDDGVPPDNVKELGNINKGPTPTIDPIKPTRVPLTSQSASYAQVTGRSSKDTQDSPPGATEDGAGPRVASQRPPNPPGHFPDNEQREMSEVRQSAQSSQSANYGQGGGVVMGAIKYFMPTGAPTPPKDKYEQLKDDYRKLQRDMKSVYADLEAHKHEVRRTHGEIRSFKHYINQLHHERQQFNDHMGSLQNELTNVHQQLEDAKTLSEVRGKELFGAQVFLTKADTLSISEVSEKVTALNEEIFQAAATLGEALIHQRHELSQEELDAATASSREMVGEKITNLLISQAQKPEPEVNPLLVQVVLQIFVVTFCVSKIQSWYPGDSTIGEFLTAIYSTIRSSEEQAVSGRWRALTRAHTRPTTETWTEELSQKLMAVLKIAAWMPSSPENQDSFANRLPPIFKAVNELRLAIGEKFTSADLDVSVFEPDTLYESSYMEDAYGDGRQPSGKRAPEVVVGTTGIGLKKLMAERDKNDNLLFQNVTSAKIVLESTLKEALKPVQSSGKLTRKKKPVENADGADPENRGSSKPKTGFIGIGI